MSNRANKEIDKLSKLIDTIKFINSQNEEIRNFRLAIQKHKKGKDFFFMTENPYFWELFTSYCENNYNDYFVDSDKASHIVVTYGDSIICSNRLSNIFGYEKRVYSFSSVK